MKKLEWAKFRKSKADRIVFHSWSIFVNPRNQKIALVACSVCGILQATPGASLSCNTKSTRVSTMLSDKGWVKSRAAS